MGVVSISTGIAETPNFVVPPYKWIIKEVQLKFVHASLQPLFLTGVVVLEWIGRTAHQDEIAVGAIIFGLGLAWVLDHGVSVPIELLIKDFGKVGSEFDRGTWRKCNLGV